MSASERQDHPQGVRTRRLPDDAPNILIVLIDDAGPGLPTTFGGQVRTDMRTRVHEEGIGFNRFHTTAMCSPTRASLLTCRRGQTLRVLDRGMGKVRNTTKGTKLLALHLGGTRDPTAVR